MVTILSPVDVSIANNTNNFGQCVEMSKVTPMLLKLSSDNGTKLNYIEYDTNLMLRF